MPGRHTEAAFEAAIEEHLVSSGGYTRGDQDAFDPERCIDARDFLAFVRETQPREWEYLQNLQKEKAESVLLDDLCRALNSDHEGEKIELSKLIDILNERFGTDFKPADQLFLDSIREDAVADAGIRRAAMANTMENFGYVFLKALEDLFIDRMEQNEEITARFMNNKDFQDVVGKHLLRTVYEQIRSEKPGIEPFRRVTPVEKDKYRTCVPLLTLKAAAGAFGDVQAVEPDGWVEPNTKQRLRPGMFVAQVVCRSMEPMIPDGAWCLFQSTVEGSRQGRIVLVQHRDIDDPETGGSYTVKRYHSKKQTDQTDNWRHTEIRLEPENPKFQPIILKGVRDNNIRVIAEVIEVITETGKGEE